MISDAPIRVFFDGSFRPRIRSTRWAIVALLENTTITKHGPCPKRGSHHAEAYALRQAKRLAKHYAALGHHVIILGDHEGLLLHQTDTEHITYQVIDREENLADLPASLHPLPVVQEPV